MTGNIENEAYLLTELEDVKEKISNRLYMEFMSCDCKHSETYLQASVLVCELLEDRIKKALEKLKENE